MVINVTFKTLNGLERKGVLSDNFGAEELCRLTEHLLGKEAVNEWTFTVKGKQFQMTDLERIKLLKKLITNNCSIVVARRSQGGTYMPAHTFAEKFIADVNRAVDAMKNTIVATCPICLGSGRRCLQFSCNKCSYNNVLCKDCFVAYLKISDLRYRCLSCRKSIELLVIFPNVPILRASINTFNEMAELRRNIDCQICRCGEAKVNTTMYSKQYCERCPRWYCFFCNETWNDTTMTNTQYTCHNNCYYENKITYELIPYTCGNRPGIQHIPYRRHCPNPECLEICARVNGYGGSCSHHTCESCGQVFCFICLRPGQTCANDTKNCTSIKQQTYENFPKSTDI